MPEPITIPLSAKHVALACEKPGHGGRYSLEELAIYAEGGMLTLVATNGKLLVRLDCINSAADALTLGPVLIPGKSLKDLKPEKHGWQLTLEPLALHANCITSSIVQSDAKVPPFADIENSTASQLASEARDIAPAIGLRAGSTALALTIASKLAKHYGLGESGDTAKFEYGRANQPWRLSADYGPAKLTIIGMPGAIR